MSKKDTHLKILKAAETLFAANGYDGVSTKQIASEANVTEMTLFNHFESKENLYNSVVKEKYLKINIESVFDSLSYNNLENDLKIIASAILKNFFENKTILAMRLKEKESFHHDKAFMLEDDPIYLQVKPIFKKYTDKKYLKMSSENTAKLFIAAIKGMCHIYLLENKINEELSATVYDFVSVFCNGILI